MRFILSMLAVLALALGVLTACQKSAAPVATKTNANSAKKVDEHGHEDGAPRITIAEAKKEFDNDNVVFVDTRADAAYKQEHIKGALNIPTEAVATRYSEIPTGKKIVAYCS